MKRIKAPIDNKNVCEWFTTDFHNDDYIEHVKCGVVHQVFYMFDCLCQISYKFGQNWFRIRVIEGDPDDILKCQTEIDRIITGMNNDDNESKVIYNPVYGMYEFYFVES